MTRIETDITYLGEAQTVACDGRCDKAWGVNLRPRVPLDPDDEDDYCFLADDELGEAPVDPGTYEGGHGKLRARPARSGGHNKWCARECERSERGPRGEVPDLLDFARRVYNMPWLHKEGDR